VWSRYEEPKEEVLVQENEVLERKISYKTVVVTEITPEMHFYAQNTETGKLMLIIVFSHMQALRQVGLLPNL